MGNNRECSEAEDGFFEVESLVAGLARCDFHFCEVVSALSFHCDMKTIINKIINYIHIQKNYFGVEMENSIKARQDVRHWFSPSSHGNASE